MKKYIAVCAGVGLLGLAYGDVVLNINDFAINGATVSGTTPNVGDTLTYTGPFSSTVAMPSPVTFAVTWSGLNLDNVGGANDTITFDYVVRGSTTSDFASSANVRADGNGWGVAAPNISSVGYSLRTSISNVQVDDDMGGSITFDGFSQMRMKNFTAQTSDSVYAVNGQTITFTTSDASGATGAVKPADFALSPTATITMTTDGGAGARFLSSDVQFSYVIPEPATMGLLSASAFGLLVLRRLFA